MKSKRALAIIISIIMVFTYMPGNIVNADEMPIEKVYMVATMNDQMPTGLDDPDILRDRPAVGTEFYLWVLTSAVDELVGTDIWVNFDPTILSVADMDATTDGIQPIMIPSGVNTANEVSISEVTAVNTVENGIIKYAASNKTPLNFPQGAVLLKSKFKVNAEITDGLYFDFGRPIELRGKLGSDNNPIRIIPGMVQPFHLAPYSNQASISEIWNAAITANSDSFDLFVYGNNLQQLSGTIVELQRQDGTAVATTDMGNTNNSWYGVYPNDDGYSMSLNMRALDANGIPEYTGYKFAVYTMDGTNKVPAANLTIEPGATIDATTEPYIGAHLRPWAIKPGLDYPINIEFSIENINNVEPGTKFVATLENGTTVITSKSVTLDVNDVPSYVTNIVDAYFEFSAANPLPQTSMDSGWKLHLYKNSVDSANLLRSNQVLYYIDNKFSIFDSAITPNTPGNTSYTLSFYGWNIQPGHAYTIKYTMPGESAERAFDITSTDGRSLEFVWDTSKGIPATGLVDGDYVFRIWDGTVKLHGEGFTIGNVVPPTVPPPPAGGTVDDVNDTYVFVPNTQYPLATDYEYSLDNGQTWKACTTTTIVVGNVALPAEYVQVRVKADSASGRSAGPAQMSDRAYTVNASLTNVIVESKTGRTNSTVQISINVNDIKQFTGGNFEVEFDPSVISFSSGAIETTDLTNGFLTTVNDTNAATGKIIVVLSGSKAVNGTGTIFRLNFNVVGTQGQSSAINLNKCVFNGENDTQIPVSVTNGNITINNVLIGDVSGNGSISTYDATLILRHIAGISQLSNDALVAADTSGNGSISTFDATLILRYIAGIINTFPASNK